MTQYVDRNQVLKTTKVRTSLKNDGSWIQSSEREKEEQDQAGTDLCEKTKPAEVKQKSYVLSTAKIFESVEDPVSLPPAPTTEGDSTTESLSLMTNGEVVLPQEDAQPGGSTEETTDNTKPKEHTEEQIQNDEAQPGNTAEENKEAVADEPVDQSNTGDKQSTAEVSADIHVQNEAVTFSSTKENPDAASPAKPAEQPVVTAESEVEHAVTAAEQSFGDPTQDKVSADAGVEDPVAETSDVAETEEKNEPAEVPADAFEVKPQEEPSVETEPANDAHLEVATVVSTEQAAEVPQEDAGEVFEAVAAVVVESSNDTSDGIHATPEEEAPLKNSVEPIPDLLFDSLANSLNLNPVSESLNQSAANTTAESEEANVEAAAPEEADLKTRVEELPEGKVQPVDDTAPEKAADPVQVELDITDAVEPIAASEGGAVQSVLPDGGIELTDALDVELPTTEAAPAPEPVDDPQQSPSEEAEPNQSDDTNTTDLFQKPRDEQQSKHLLKVTSDGKAICSFCDTIIDGLIKLTFSDPLLTCHAECLKCGVCAKGLGELLRPMFLRDQLIQCDGCFFSRREA
ncbi:enolase-phosphatase E1 [Platichthys flesus]|uniref:enolase-phosphatase E1 n=1 Tax=Platichthys flesus TaxID=8260 RepID=UPI002DB6E709|nr:enolase-phosphatase E1 [Platichthys flesus]